MMNSADIRYFMNLTEQEESDRIWQNSVQNWNRMPDEYQQRLLKAFPDIDQFISMISSDFADFMTFEYKPHERILHFHTDAEGGGAVIYLSRFYNMRADTLKLHRLTLDSEIQGNGIGIDILKGTVKVAKKLNIKQLTLDASDTGSYVWIMAGFIPWGTADNRPWLNRLKRKEFKALPDNVQQDIRKFVERFLYDDDTMALWELADYPATLQNGMKVGKAVLLNQEWSGYFNPGDPKQMKRFKEYCNRK